MPGAPRATGRGWAPAWPSVRTAADALETGDHEATQFGPARRPGFFAADYDYAACPVDDRLADGDELRVGRLTVRYVATPGPLPRPRRLPRERPRRASAAHG